MRFEVLILLAAIVMAHHPWERMQSNTSGIATQNFIQKVNHTVDAGSATFKQRYQLNTQHFEPGGPILFIQSAEAGMPPINASDFMDYAPKLKALVVMLEHRFFGDLRDGSYPPGFNPRNMSMEAFSSLTLDNVLQDGVNFVNWIKATVIGATNSRVIYGSSSYGGFLAVSARMRYPDTFYGAIASSPALNSFGPTGSNRYKFDSAKWASNIYDDVSKNASVKIKMAMLAFKKCIADNTCDAVIPDLNVCKNSTVLGYERLYNAVLHTYLAVSKFNYPWVEKYPSTYPLQDLVKQTLEANSAGQVLRIPLLAASWANGSFCIDGFNGNISKASQGNIASNQPAFGYVICDYYPINDRSVPSNNMLPETFARGAVDLCSNSAWKSADYSRENEYFLQKYAITNDLLDTTNRLLIVQGQYDRTTAIGSPILTVTDMLNHSRVILVNNTAHAEDSVSEAIEPRGMKPEMDQIRDIKLAHLKEWLGQGNQTQASARQGQLYTSQHGLRYTSASITVKSIKRPVHVVPSATGRIAHPNMGGILSSPTHGGYTFREIQHPIRRDQISSPALAHFRVALPLYNPPGTLNSTFQEPTKRILYIAPGSDLIATPGRVGMVRLANLLKAARDLDPKGQGIRSLALPLANWLRVKYSRMTNLEPWMRELYKGFDELVLLMYDERKLPTGLDDGGQWEIVEAEDVGPASTLIRRTPDMSNWEVEGYACMSLMFHYMSHKFLQF
ncbi:serine carboxypeptidase S28-domain-containing protein [Hypoxylon trugodes]|uniref:serine carboxypeptidase S28-domain-containing protein n=1 Tax=Hypoxylon trugodes TaxID=326681 RepID=UPI00219071DC|nr:serine carboxypeptidase S28-domain-containing protein [Hypoxylon trugodes]KAI1390750.1 serine carboxypeptidase S28-domain-containing protein [Hypoxylon trugodes]